MDCFYEAYYDNDTDLFIECTFGYCDNIVPDPEQNCGVMCYEEDMVSLDLPGLMQCFNLCLEYQRVCSDE